MKSHRTPLSTFAALAVVFSLSYESGVAAPGEVGTFQKIAAGVGGLPISTLPDFERFGQSCVSLGDLDGDGVPELAVGAHAFNNRGALHVLFLNADGTVKSSTKIADGVGGLPASTLADDDFFGTSCANLGDLDGDGVPELAVGAAGDDTGGTQGAFSECGAVHVLFLNADGTVKSNSKIADGVGGLPGSTLADGDFFGISSTNLGDLDGDGVPELAVGAFGDSTGGSFRGALHVLFLNADGTVKSNSKIADGVGGLPGSTLANFDRFGGSCTNLGDLDGDGVPELAVGATDDDTVGNNQGALYVLFLNADGTVKSNSKIADGVGGLPGSTLADDDEFGGSCVSLGDLDGDGVPELAVGATVDDTGGPARGALHVLFLNADGTVKSNSKIADGVGGLPGSTLANGDRFGGSCTSLGDLDGDGVPEIAAGVTTDDTGGPDRGAVYILEIGDLPLSVTTAVDEFDTPSGAAVSLREAMRDAKTTGEFRTINFDPSLNGQTITLGGTELALVDQEVKITAAALSNGITITGNDQSRIFNVDASSTLGLECVNLTGGSQKGGGIQNFGKTAVSQSYFHGNHAAGNGGAIFNQGELLVQSSSFFDNSTPFVGGAINSPGGGTTTLILNSTFFGNTANGEGGGALNVTGSSSAIVRQCTFVGNEAPNGEGGGLRVLNVGTIHVVNSIIAENTAGMGSMDISRAGDTITAGGNNLIGCNESVEDVFLSAAPLAGTSFKPISASLFPLGSYGGRTPTMPPRAGSLAVDFGYFFPLPGADQRGVARVKDFYPDLGAVEGVYVDNTALKLSLAKKIKNLKKQLKTAKRKRDKRKIKKLKRQIKSFTRRLRSL